MKIIAIESSHDDTSVVLYENKKIIKDFSFSQTKFHSKFGGTIPELASRLHFEKMLEILPQLLKQDLTNLDHIAYTSTPGLIGSLHMGRIFAHSLGITFNVPVKAINHMFAHIYAVEFSKKIVYPAISLIASGGHTQLWLVKAVNEIELLGETKDDAAGEVFDKVARALGLGFPGGPEIDKRFDSKKATLDLSISDSNDFSFSFSGLKTKVINFIHKQNQTKTEIDVIQVCSSFQKTIVDILLTKTKRAIIKYKPASIILGGGVSANSLLREEFLKLHSSSLIPDMEFTTDNAKMIAIRSHIKEEHEQ